MDEPKPMDEPKSVEERPIIQVPARCQISAFFGDQAQRIADLATTALGRSVIAKPLDQNPPSALAADIAEALLAAGFRTRITVKVNRTTGFRVVVRPPGDQRFRL